MRRVLFLLNKYHSQCLKTENGSFQIECKNLKCSTGTLFDQKDAHDDEQFLILKLQKNINYIIIINKMNIKNKNKTLKKVKQLL